MEPTNPEQNNIVTPTAAPAPTAPTPSTPEPAPSVTLTPPAGSPKPIMSANSTAKKSKKPLIIILIVVVILLLAGGAAYALKFKPKKEAVTTTPTSKPVSTAQNAGPKCLNLQDFPDADAANYSYTTNVFFNADATTYEFPDQLDTNLKPIVNAYNKYKDRKFKIAVTGSVRLGDNKAQDLAKARADKVITELKNRGIPADVLYVGTPKDSTTDSGGSATSSLATDNSNRNALIQFDTCDPSDPNYVAPA